MEEEIEIPVSLQSFDPKKLGFKNKKYQPKIKLEKITQEEENKDLMKESKYPVKHYCAMTGFEACYRDPKTNLYYHNYKIFSKIRRLNENTIREFKSVENKF